ncbi:hypothetical protein D2Q93_02740 [Alicyclobacillaceae bacterium I2511]|nr:hypothetical protein D2Q93_02740 [Alicyclobacillaceae bacterium I2511]
MIFLRLNSNEHVQELSDAVRVSFILGPDVLKVPYPGSADVADVLKEWITFFQILMVLLGGSTSGTTQQTQLLDDVQQAIEVGARAIAIGKNVWQRPIE